MLRPEAGAPPTYPSGAPVLASADDLGLLYCTLHWGGLELTTDGRTFMRIAPLAPQAGFEGEWTMHEWQQLRRCLALGIDQALLALARAHMPA